MQMHNRCEGKAIADRKSLASSEERLGKREE